MLPDTAREALPVFPLPNVVLMPGQALPLHIFEPRYRDLLAHAMRTDRLIGMGTLEGDVLHEVVGVGKVVRCEPEPDGRANIVIVHIATVRLGEECTLDRTFRQFQTEELPNVEPDPTEVAAVRSLLYQLAAATEGLTPEALKITELDGLELVHAIARRLYQDPEPRKIYLELTDAQRTTQVCAALAGLLSNRPAVGEA